MSLLEATEWLKEYKAFMAHNATNLERHEAKVPRELLEVNIDPVMKMKLRSKQLRLKSEKKTDKYSKVVDLRLSPCT